MRRYYGVISTPLPFFHLGGYLNEIEKTDWRVEQVCYAGSVSIKSAVTLPGTPQKAMAPAYVIVVSTDWPLDMIDPPPFPELKIGGAE